MCTNCVLVVCKKKKKKKVKIMSARWKVKPDLCRQAAVGVVWAKRRSAPGFPSDLP